MQTLLQVIQVRSRFLELCRARLAFFTGAVDLAVGTLFDTAGIDLLSNAILLDLEPQLLQTLL
ncbi:hypothetical protein GV819_25590 [Pseudomonas sp. Fl5BN2]|uniref:hypothetical protein n=1 Tax=Pseudomonas sp. Fl5BN2 TaxID=2697652 RepID=UPI00137744B8|nr:hypothetical protein [Pseudomonas sp. Fl5BN2]NBF05672.1 hypothetical protein [Pseudomonas sp. Fl5BN2]